MRLREFNGEIRAGNVLLIDCPAIVGGQQHCCGKIRIPFHPPLVGFSPIGDEKRWLRDSGESIDTITLSPSIDAGNCGHFLVRSGEIVLC